MFSQELIQAMQAEREREIEAELRVRRLLQRRGASIRWHLRRPARPRGSEQRAR